MEPAAAVECVQEFFADTQKYEGEHAAFIDTLCSDDDASTWANVQQSLTLKLEEVNAEREKEGKELFTKRTWPTWPKQNDGTLKQDHGKIC